MCFHHSTCPLSVAISDTESSNMWKNHVGNRRGQIKRKTLSRMGKLKHKVIKHVENSYDGPGSKTGKITPKLFLSIK